MKRDVTRFEFRNPGLEHWDIRSSHIPPAKKADFCSRKCPPHLARDSKFNDESPCRNGREFYVYALSWAP